MSLHTGYYSSGKQSYSELKNHYLIQSGGNNVNHRMRRSEGSHYSVESERLADEIHFWGNQMKEHCEFLLAETRREDFKVTILRLHDKFDTYMKRIFANIEPEKIMLDESDFKLIAGDLETNVLFALLDELEQLKLAIKNEMEKEWIGFTYPAEIDHMIKEMNHFRENIKNSLSDEAIAKFYAEESAEHTILAHKLLNPCIEPIDIKDRNTLAATKETKEAAMEIKNINKDNVNESLQYVEKLTKAAGELESKIKNHAVKSIINKKMIAHEEREGKRGIAIMKMITNRRNK